MTIGFSTRTLLALPRALRRVVRIEPLDTSRRERVRSRRLTPFTAFGSMMERQADLIIRQMGE